METDNAASRQVIIDGLRDHLCGPHQRTSSGALVEAEAIWAGKLRKTTKGTVREDIDQRPEDFYHVGVLWPVEEPVDGEDDDQVIDEIDPAGGSSADSPIALSNAMRQAAMGLSLFLDPDLKSIGVDISWGMYRLESDDPEESDLATQGDTDTLADGQASLTESRLVWRRRPMAFSFEIDLSKLASGRSETVGSSEDMEGVEFSALIRGRGSNRFLTLTLVNRRDSRRPVNQSESPCIFQSRISAKATGSAGFVSATNTGRRKSLDREYWNHELLYRDFRQFGVGHGISVKWSASKSDRSADSVWTEWIPDVEVKKADPDSLEDRSPLDISLFADPKGRRDPERLNTLRSLPQEYQNWIESQHQLVANRCDGFPADVQDSIRDVAKENLDFCRAQRERINAGIRFLEEDPMAFEAFHLMSRAMWKTMSLDREGPYTWFPFQLAFILLAIPSAVNPTDEKRELFDLIWFPTGGGKTEAYLGLTAFILFYRYLTNSPERAGGTAVLTRYTLRLLTTQQFERSAKTIAACELVRREEPTLQNHPPFTIGILVGSRSTPNSLEDAKNMAAQGQTARGESGDEATVLPIEGCPWCKTTLNPFEPYVVVDLSRKSIVTRCPNESCEFHSGLPVVAVDDAMYASPPSFVIATIDKLARLSTEPRMARLVGSGTEGLPPDLIIQDELHLINDALGTVAALFEMAIEFLAHDPEGRVPKLIGSTATIRQADYQIRQLYNREVAQFPPDGLAIDDSFFYRTDHTRPGRTYVGVHAQGRATKTTLPVLLGLLAQLPKRIRDKKLRDPYATNVAYFNSLRELGGALVLAEDDANRYLDAQFPDDPLAAEHPRGIIQIEELTGRLPFTAIKKMFRQMEVAITDDSADEEPLDLVLASSMLSVGVDINRLGLMLVNGQPKTTSEYIQATSRVGRATGAAGLVVTFYNWSRPRDRSHYERFVGYHQSFYRYVEAVSVTPFSVRARERALKGALVAMIRGLKELRENVIEPQLLVDLDQKDSVVSKHLTLVRDALKRRVDSLAEEEAGGTLQEFDDFCNMLQKEGENCIEDERELVWMGARGPQKGRSEAILADFNKDPSALGADQIVVPLSMRDVDIQTRVVSFVDRYRETS